MDTNLSNDTITPTVNGVLTVSSTGALTVPSGSTVNRPGSPTTGMVRVNTTTGRMEYYNGSAWVTIITVSQIAYGTITAASGTTQIALSNSAPTSSAGTQIWSQSFTPVSTSSLINVVFSMTVDTDSSLKGVIVTVFRGTTLIGVEVNWGGDGGALSANGTPGTIAFNIIDAPATTSALTYSARAGVTSSGTWYVAQALNGTMGGSLSQYMIREWL